MIRLKKYGSELILDIHGCDPKTIRSSKKLRQFVKLLCKKIKMKRYGKTRVEHFGHKKPETSGYSIFQFIETSSITGHLSELWNSAYLNIFSCKEFDPKKVKSFAKEFFKAKRVKNRFIKR